MPEPANQHSSKSERKYACDVEAPYMRHKHLVTRQDYFAVYGQRKGTFELRWIPDGGHNRNRRTSGRTEVVIDIRASRRVISKSQYQELREQGKWTETRTEITLGNGTRQRTTGRLEAKIRFGERLFTISFMILERLSGGILLGIDLMARFHFVLRCGNRELEISASGKDDGSEDKQEGNTST